MKNVTYLCSIKPAGEAKRRFWKGFYLQNGAFLLPHLPKATFMVTYNLVAYCIYGLITYLITVRIGWICYRNGYHFILAEIGNEQIALSANKLLLVCYYLTNLGYITLMISNWQSVHTFQEMIESISYKVAVIVLGLGCLHFMNMAVVYFLRKKNPTT